MKPIGQGDRTKDQQRPTLTWSAQPSVAVPQKSENGGRAWQDDKHSELHPIGEASNGIVAPDGSDIALEIRSCGAQAEQEKLMNDGEEECAAQGGPELVGRKSGFDQMPPRR